MAWPQLWRAEKRDVTGKGLQDLLWSKRLTGLTKLNRKIPAFFSSKSPNTLSSGTTPLQFREWKTEAQRPSLVKGQPGSGVSLV